MKTVNYSSVDLLSGYLFDKQELNRKVTLSSVYDRFSETGRIGAFKHGYPEKDSIRPHYFWDSDVAKWMEGAAYSLAKHPDPTLEAKVDEIIDDIEKNQHPDGYFNIYFTVVEPEKRWSNRDWHELYCAGHLMEAAVAYSEATGKTKLLSCMEKYADYIEKVFVTDASAAFVTPGHEEIELALIRMYRHTGNKKYLDLAAFFINKRGTEDDIGRSDYNQSHIPVREQSSAVGHSVRAVYLYTGMAYLAAETGDEDLKAACKRLWNDIVNSKMYITGGLGSTCIGEAFTTPYDLPNDQAYTETCAGIGLMFFANAMLALENNAEYADVIERVLYNGVLSGLSHSGKEFFYENPLEINRSEHFRSSYGERRFPAQRRVECFGCSCCPPNINRLLSSLGNYVYGSENDTLYINQFITSELNCNGISANIKTDYPIGCNVSINARGVSRIAIRIPSWCKEFKVDKIYTEENGYAVIENSGDTVTVTLDMSPRLVWSDPKVLRNAGRVAVTRGPIVYCAEGIDNCENELHSYILSENSSFEEVMENSLVSLKVGCKKRMNGNKLYRYTRSEAIDVILKLIPYNYFANRETTDMRVWFSYE